MFIAQLLLLAATLLGVDSYYTKIKDITLAGGKKTPERYENDNAPVSQR